MSELHAMPVDNGQRLAIACQFFTGTAGVCADEVGGEFACPGAMPIRMPELTGTIDGRPIRILSLRKSAIVAGMLVARFEFLEGSR